MDARKGIELLLTPGITPAHWSRLEVVFRDADDTASAELDAAAVLNGLPRSLFTEDVEHQMDAMARADVRLIFRWDAEYPSALRAVATSPPALFVRGQFPAPETPVVAIVGTRKPSAGGSAFTFQLAKTLSLLGVVVVSGMARGIDTAAHQGALAAGAVTIAVLGTGVDVAYPPENAALMEQIAQSGVVVSEQVCGLHPFPGVFPQRNRIISGVSDAVVVVEGGARSGALITAKWALEQGRDVGAVPGFPGGFRSEGPNRLLKQGAFLVEDAVDVVTNVKRIAECVHANACAVDDADGLDGDAARAYDVVGNSTSVDDVALAAGIPVEHAQSLLTMLEIEGRIRRDDAGNYARLAGSTPR